LIYFKLFLSEPFRLIEQKRFQDKVDESTPHKSPVFIIGHWRSGTTYAHMLLSCDPEFAFQSKYMNFFSDNFLTTEAFFKPVLSRFMSYFSPAKQWQDNITKTMHLDTPSESDTALISEISEYTYHWAHLFPKSYKKYFDKFLFFEDLTAEELKQWKDTMHTMINKTHLKYPDNRLLIKNPGDTGRIKHLLDIYPGAKFIFLHRNPYEVFYSNLKLWKQVINTVALQSVSEKEQRDIVLHLYSKLHQGYIDQTALLRPDQLVEVSHQQIVESPHNTLRAIYNQLELPGFDKAMPHTRDFLEQLPPWRNSDYPYHPEDIMEINTHWDFVFDLWSYPKLDPGKGSPSLKDRRAES
jgi:hypothetical protein